MFPVLPIVALCAAATVSGLVVPRVTAPVDYAVGYLEDYTVYHTRYVALGCQAKHNTSFFNQCCHPMLVGFILLFSYLHIVELQT